LETRRAEQVLPMERVGTNGRVEVAGKEGRRVNMVLKKCVSRYVNAKIIPVETVP
jgi:hypothetical protein